MEMFIFGISDSTNLISSESNFFKLGSTGASHVINDSRFFSALHLSIVFKLPRKIRKLSLVIGSIPNFSIILFNFMFFLILL